MSWTLILIKNTYLIWYDFFLIVIQLQNFNEENMNVIFQILLCVFFCNPSVAAQMYFSFSL